MEQTPEIQPTHQAPEQLKKQLAEKFGETSIPAENPTFVFKLVSEPVDIIPKRSLSDRLSDYAAIITGYNLLVGMSGKNNNPNDIAQEMSHALVVARRTVASDLIRMFAITDTLSETEKIELISSIRNARKISL